MWSEGWGVRGGERGVGSEGCGVWSEGWGVRGEGCGVRGVE